MNSIDFSKDLINFIDASPLNYFAVKNAGEILEANGFKKLREDEAWNLGKGKYYTTRDDSALIAFEIGEDLKKGFEIIGSHTDSPTFKVKSNPEMSDTGFLKLNIEAYGGMIHSTWLDRTLSLAGKVAYRAEGEIKYALVNIDRDFLTIANAAIHMNREINKGYAYNTQDNLYPLVETIKNELEGDNYLVKTLAEELKIKTDDILDFDLGLYDRQKGAIINNMVQVGRLDNLGSVHASLRALVDSKAGKNKMILLSDNEEIGSRTRGGAASNFLGNILERIALKFGLDKEDYQIMVENSMIISADQAHATHPNYKAFADPTNVVKMNEGLVIKIAANGAYATSIETKARLINLSKKYGYKLQTFHNRNDKVGGSTIGPITATSLGIKAIDVGIPLLAMHSIRELAGVEDIYQAYEIYKKFFEED
ncbi:M18 family aminopeptidase [uncultured Anaerococcus sp.]|uniref:M18 family aminopeptidase n=1 Tax=uncultured Anaerococcus sp. TaxID=293428 RepID=UPI00288ABDC5|nr:M18 family aminopeptidase [uncultured Anaerococcus sp.]